MMKCASLLTLTAVDLHFLVELQNLLNNGNLQGAKDSQMKLFLLAYKVLMLPLLYQLTRADKEVFLFCLVSPSKWWQFFYVTETASTSRKKIWRLSLLQQKALEASRLALHDHLPMEEQNSAAAAECLWLQDYLENIDLENLESDFSVIYFVSGYIAQSVSRRRKCESCKQNAHHCIALLTMITFESC